MSVGQVAAATAAYMQTAGKPLLRGVLEEMRKAPGSGSQLSPSANTLSTNPNLNTACVPGACYHHGLYFYEPDGPATVVNRDSAHDTCLQLLNDVPDDGAHDSISDMLNECVNGGQCDGSSSDAAGMQQCGESVSEPALVDDVPHGDDSNASVIDLDVLESALKDAWLGVLEDKLAHTACSHAISENVVEPCVTDSCATSDHAVHTVSGAGQHDGSCDDSNVVLRMNTRHYKRSGVTGKKHLVSLVGSMRHHTLSLLLELRN